MNEDLRNRVHLHVIDQVEGGVCKSIETLLDEAIDEGHISQDEFRQNELDILGCVDNFIFTCEQCGWTQPIENMSDRVDEWICEDCYEDNT